jgi:hypothetical protein
MQDSLFYPSQPTSDRIPPIPMGLVFIGRRVAKHPRKLAERIRSLEQATEELRRFLMEEFVVLTIVNIVRGEGEWIEVFALEQWGAMSVQDTRGQIMRTTPEEWLGYPIYIVFVPANKS